MNCDELLYRRIPSLMPGLRPPRAMSVVLKTKRSSAGSRWMRRNEIDQATLEKGGWNLLLLTVAFSIALISLSIAFLGAGMVAYCLVPCLVAPLISSSLYVNSPEQRAKAEERQMLREAPSIIGGMAMSMQVAPSLESAVAFASERGGGVLARRLKEARWSNLTRHNGSLEQAIEELSSSLSESAFSLRQSLHLLISSTSERTKEGMDRLLDKANTVVLNGVKDAVDSYVASLSLPTMVLFSLGTLLPIMLFSLLPLLSIGTSLGGTTPSVVPLPSLAFLLLAVIPMSALIYSWRILSRNPLGLTSSPENISSLIRPLLLLVWAAFPLIAVMFARGPLAPYIISGTMVLPPCAYFGWVLRRQTDEAKRRRKLERDASSALFQIGNRMLSGATLEKALGEIAADHDHAFAALVREMLYRARLSGEGMDAVIIDDGRFGAASPDLENAYVTVARCSERDPVNAGQVALNLAQMLSDLRSCQGKTEERLKGVVDMMRSTSTLFAPIVLGVTGALFALIGTRAAEAASMADSIVLITGIYIGELSFLISFFTVLLMGERSWKGVAFNFAVRTPVAFGVFVVVSLISRTGLTAPL